MYMRLVFLFILSFNLFAQEVEIDDIDPSLLQNLTPEQLSNLQNLNSSEFSELDTSEQTGDEESLEEGELVKEPTLDTRFGINYFSKIPTTITPTQDLPVPGDYRVSLGDKLSILLSGSKDAKYTLSVNLDGTIQIPEIGALNIVGSTLNEINDLITNLIQKTYVGVSANVTITGLSAKKVTIVGAVEIPGSYLVNPFTTISSVLAYSGGIKEYGSLRNINVIKSNGERYTFDLYDLLIYGDRTNDRTVDAGDTILINGTANFVKIDGAVIRPGTYEYTDNESIDDLIDYALGLRGIANTKKISARKVNPDNLTLESYEVKLGDQASPEGVLTLTAFEMAINTRLDILVQGPLMNAGYFQHEEYSTLTDLIKDLKFTDNLYPFAAVLEQYDPDQLTARQYIFSLNDESTYKNIKLKPNDKILFLSRQTFESDIQSFGFNLKTTELFNSYKLKLNIVGNRFEVPVYGKYSIQDFINYFGVNFNEINEKRVLVKNFNKVQKNVQITDEIIAEKNQSISIFEESKFDLFGPAKISGKIPIEDSIILMELLANLSFDEEIYPFIGVVEKFNPDSLETESILFSLEDTRTQNIEIDNYSKVFLFSRSTFNQLDVVPINVQSLQLIKDYDLQISYRGTDFNFPVFGQFSVNKIVEYLGLDLDDIEKGQTTYVQPLENFTIVDSYENMNFNSSKFHKLSFRFRNSELITVNVSGEVNLPGTYTLETTATLYDLYKLMGGFKENAAQEAVILQRESVRQLQVNALEDARRSLREYIVTNAQQGNNNLDTGLVGFVEQSIEPSDLGRIGGDFRLDNPKIKDFTLTDGDTIYVPQKLNTVSVIGEVLNPNTVLYDKRISFSKYINNAGGYKQFALKRGVYVIKANGTIQK